METKKGNLVWKVLIIAMCGIILLGLGKPATDNVKDLLGNKDSQTEESIDSPGENLGESSITGSDNPEDLNSPVYQFTVQSFDGTHSKTYTYSQGMTWENFVSSAYNVGGVFSSSSNGVTYSGFETNQFNFVMIASGDRTPATVYIESKTYVLASYAGGGND